MSRLETLQKLVEELEDKLQKNGFNKETAYTIEVVEAEIKRIKEVLDERKKWIK